MRQIAFALVMMTSTAFAQQPGPQTAPTIPFDSVPAFLKLPPDIYLGEAAGVAVNSKGHVFVFSRGGTTGPAYGAAAAQLLGKFLREIGRNLYAWSFAHAVRVDRQDNIRAIDKGSDMVIKFNPEGRVTMVFGRKKEASDEAAEPWKHPSPPAPPVDGMFRQVTDVAWDPAGNTYISDGYINSRVAKYDPDGNWIKSWGEFGTEPGQFRILHSIQADAEGHIYVGDGNLIRIIKIDVPFDYAKARPAIGPKPGAPDGSLASYAAALTIAPGSPWALCITPPPDQVLYSSDVFPGRIYKMTLDGKVLGVLGESGKKLKQFGWIHEIACPSENELYVAELLNWRVQKLILHPDRE